MAETKTRVAVAIVPRESNPKKNEYAVTLDGEIVLRSSGAHRRARGADPEAVRR